MSFLSPESGKRNKDVPHISPHIECGTLAPATSRWPGRPMDQQSSQNHWIQNIPKPIDVEISLCKYQHSNVPKHSKTIYANIN